MADHTFCREELKAILKDVSVVLSKEEIKKAWVHKTRIVHDVWEFVYGDFHTVVDGDCSASAKADGWMQWLEAKYPEQTVTAAGVKNYPALHKQQEDTMPNELTERINAILDSLPDDAEDTDDGYSILQNVIEARYALRDERPDVAERYVQEAERLLSEWDLEAGYDEYPINRGSARTAQRWHRNLRRNLDQAREHIENVERKWEGADGPWADKVNTYMDRARKYLDKDDYESAEREVRNIDTLRRDSHTAQRFRKNTTPAIIDDVFIKLEDDPYLSPEDTTDQDDLIQEMRDGAERGIFNYVSVFLVAKLDVDGYREYHKMHVVGGVDFWSGTSADTQRSFEFAKSVLDPQDLVEFKKSLAESYHIENWDAFPKSLADLIIDEEQ